MAKENTTTKLFILEKRQGIKWDKDPWHRQYEAYHAFVVRAESEQKARELAHNCRGDENQSGLNPWLNREYTSCKELKAGGGSGVVIIGC